MPISVVFDPPLPSDSPSTFNTKAFTLLGDLNDWSTQANALPGEVATNLTTLLASPPAIGSTTPAAGSFTTLSASDTVSITKAAGVAKAVLTSATGTNEAYYQLVNGGGGYYFGIENNAGSWFGATPYAGVVQAPAGRVVQTVISATPITTVSSSGLAVTGALSATGNATLSATNPAVIFNTSNFQFYKLNNDLRAYTEGADRAIFNASGLAVTGALSASGQIQSNSSLIAATGTPVYFGNTTDGSVTEISSPSPNVLVTKSNYTEVTRVSSSGLAVTGALTVPQITFPATQAPSADVNTLDDYEEGTWTPNQGAGLTVVGTFSSSGSYVKIGKLVYLSGVLSGSTSIASSNAPICSNLPFSASPIANGVMINNLTAASSAISASGTGLVAVSAISATQNMFFSITYSV